MTAPLTIDMYVPSLPKVQGDFGSTTSEIQLTLSFTMIGLALVNLSSDLYPMPLVVNVLLYRS